MCDVNDRRSSINVTTLSFELVFLIFGSEINEVYMCYAVLAGLI